MRLFINVASDAISAATSSSYIASTASFFPLWEEGSFTSPSIGIEVDERQKGICVNIVVVVVVVAAAVLDVSVVFDADDVVESDLAMLIM